MIFLCTSYPCLKPDRTKAYARINAQILAVTERMR